jgi:hypothetical protein
MAKRKKSESAVLTGAEFRQFYNDPSIWAEDTYVEDDVLAINGEDVDGAEFDPDALKDTDLVQVRSGYLVMAPPDVPEDYIEVVRHWKRSRATRTLVIEVSAELLDQVVRQVQAAGGRVLGHEEQGPEVSRALDSGR